MHTRTSALLLAAAALTLLTFTQAASAQEATASRSSEFGYEDGGLADIGLVIGLKAGGGFGQVFSDLGATFVGELEVGYLLPLPDPVGRDIQLFSTVSYAGPTTSGEGEPDARLPGDGVMRYDITQRQLIVGAGLTYRIPLPIPMFRPYVSAGWRAYVMRTEVRAEADGQSYGDNEETAFNPGGVFGALGGELHFGDLGAALLEVQVGYAGIDGYIMRDTNAGSLNVALGYRIFL